MGQISKRKQADIPSDFFCIFSEPLTLNRADLHASPNSLLHANKSLVCCNIHVKCQEKRK